MQTLHFFFFLLRQRRQLKVNKQSLEGKGPLDVSPKKDIGRRGREVIVCMVVVPSCSPEVVVIVVIVSCCCRMCVAGSRSQGGHFFLLADQCEAGWVR